jgi:hypothetical protein
MNSQPLDLVKLLFGNNDLFTIMESGSINDFISAILPNVHLLAGLIVFIFAVFGGFKIIAGAGDAKSTEQGKEMLTKAIIGFLIIIASYWIIEIIEVLTGLTILG